MPQTDDEIAAIISGGSVLIVEDEALLAFELQLAALDLGGTVVGPAHSLSHALNLVSQEEKIDAAILDVDIGGKDVFPVAHELEKRGVPFVFHTGHGTRDELTRLFPRAIVCPKPTTMTQLFGRLATLMADRG